MGDGDRDRWRLQLHGPSSRPRVFVCEQLCMCTLFVFNSEMFLFLPAVFSLCVYVCVCLCFHCFCVCVCPCLALFHKHLVDSVIFSSVFTPPTRHLCGQLVNWFKHTCPRTDWHKHQPAQINAGVFGVVSLRLKPK